MEYVRLGGTGMEVSRLCLGTWMFGTETQEQKEAVDRAKTHELLDAAWQRGINFFDTANNYAGGRSEQYLGEWLRDKDRENFVIASKVYWVMRGRRESGLSRKIVRAEIEGSLERLGLDYLDIYYIHGWHETSPLEETLSALNDLVRDGRVHYIGVSNFTSWQLLKALWISDVRGWEKPSVIQPRFNAADNVPFTVDPSEMPVPDLLDACRDQNIAVCSYAPLGGGFLSGKYHRSPTGEAIVPDDSRATLSTRFTYGPFPERWWAVLEAVTTVANELDATPAQVALRWVMDTNGVTSVPIVGARSIKQLDDNIGALNLTMSADQHARITDAGILRDPVSPYIYT